MIGAPRLYAQYWPKSSVEVLNTMRVPCVMLTCALPMGRLDALSPTVPMMSALAVERLDALAGLAENIVASKAATSSSARVATATRASFDRTRPQRHGCHGCHGLRIRLGARHSRTMPRGVSKPGMCLRGAGVVIE